MSRTAADRRTAKTSAMSIGDTSVRTERPTGTPGRGPKNGIPLQRPEPPGEPNCTPQHVLAPRQRRSLQGVECLGRPHSYPPTVGEIGEAVWFASVPSITHHLLCLRGKGYLSPGTGRSRIAVGRPPGHLGIHDELLANVSSREAAYVPLVGRIAAGKPILAQQSIEDVFPLPRQLVGEGNLFLLEVTGDSMINAAIADGDWVVVREQSVAENGEIVAAMVDGDATVKTFKRSDDHVWLIPHNPSYEPIPGDEATIIGKVVALLRRV